MSKPLSPKAKCRQLALMLCDRRVWHPPAQWLYEDYEDGGCSVAISDGLMVKVEPDGSWCVYETVLVCNAIGTLKKIWPTATTVVKKTFDAFI